MQHQKNKKTKKNKGYYRRIRRIHLKMEHFAKRGQYEECQSLIEHLQTAEGIDVTTQAINILLKSFMKARHYEQALHTFHATMDQSKQFKRMYDFVATIRTINILLNGFKEGYKLGDLSKEKVIEHTNMVLKHIVLAELEPTPQTITILMEFFYLMGNATMSFQLYDYFFIDMHPSKVETSTTKHNEFTVDSVKKERLNDHFLNRIHGHDVELMQPLSTTNELLLSMTQGEDKKIILEKLMDEKDFKAITSYHFHAVQPHQNQFSTPQEQMDHFARGLYMLYKCYKHPEHVDILLEDHLYSLLEEQSISDDVCDMIEGEEDRRLPQKSKRVEGISYYSFQSAGQEVKKCPVSLYELLYSILPHVVCDSAFDTFHHAMLITLKSVGSAIPDEAAHTFMTQLYNKAVSLADEGTSSNDDSRHFQSFGLKSDLIKEEVQPIVNMMEDLFSKLYYKQYLQYGGVFHIKKIGYELGSGIQPTKETFDQLIHVNELISNTAQANTFKGYRNLAFPDLDNVVRGVPRKRYKPVIVK